MTKILRTSYTAREKLRIIAYCKQNSLRNAQQKYGINFAQISKWCKNESISKAKSKNCRMAADGIAITTYMVQQKIKSLLNIEYSQQYHNAKNTFTASYNGSMAL
ncbi:10394_t:CDS:2 [Ambispora leptoticha]|uniref:10394_t:CDS:1 n=1 Tax=Ambispora leptoticha TaxID=144679 RepID=A0A9N9AHY4_9GLOM|nr:10394_t:CDS:2 [Ambispora leptoticha]